MRSLTVARQRLTNKDIEIQERRSILSRNQPNVLLADIWENDAQLKKMLQELVDLVVDPSNGIPDQEKIKYLNAEALEKEQRKIIRKLIEIDNIHPDQIKPRDDRSLLYYAVLMNDVNFTKYLLEHNAVVDKKTREIAKCGIQTIQQSY